MLVVCSEREEPHHFCTNMLPLIQSPTLRYQYLIQKQIPCTWLTQVQKHIHPWHSFLLEI